MRISILSILLSIALNYGLSAQDKTTQIKGNELIGEWTIDLRPTPDSEEYYQSFTIEQNEEGELIGTFYGSQIEDLLLNNEFEKLVFAFTTRDTSNEYVHSGYLLDGKLFGITYCPDRGFAAPWTGEKSSK